MSGELDVKTGGGNDDLSIKYEGEELEARGAGGGMYFGSTKINLGGGDDSLVAIGNISSTGTATGGGGSDYLANNQPGFLVDFSSFEEFPAV